MNLTSKTTIKALLKKYDSRPLKRFGQHFLIDKSVLQKIIKAVDISQDDIILEIGPGIGTLTQELAKRAKKIIAVEKDQRMIDILKETLVNFRNVGIVQGDILKIEKFAETRPPQVCGGRVSAKLKNYKVVANLPYYIGAPVIRKFLEAEEPPKEMVLMVQKEVGQRICAKPPKMNLLAVAVQFYAEPEIVEFVSKKSFWPQPKVAGAIIKISNLKSQMSKPNLKCQNLKKIKNSFFKIVRAGFAHPRKQLINNLSTGPKIGKEEIRTWLRENNIQASQRAETLSVDNWLGLTKTFCYNESNETN